MRHTLSVTQGEVGYYDLLTYHGIPGCRGEENLVHHLRWYNYDKSQPPFWVGGVFESVGYTLPYAVFCDVYDTVQSNDHLKNGDEVVFVHDGEEYVIVIDRAWPHCEKAFLLEKSFREAHKLSMKDSENEK